SNDVWTLLSFTPQQMQSRAARGFPAVGRLKDGVSTERAAADLRVIAGRIGADDPVSAGWSVFMMSLYESVVANVRPSLLILQGAVLFVLLIACVNVAALLSARMAGRQHEVGLQTALGASRHGLIRQMLTESVLLGLMGATAGMLLAVVGLN